MNKPAATRAGELRRAFDRGFAATPQVAAKHHADLLAIALSSAPYALQLGAVAGLYANKKITRIPTQTTALLGVAGFRGLILPVYDLAILIGLPALEAPRWVATVAGADLAIAFDAFEGHLRLPKNAVVPNESVDGGRQHISHLLRSTDTLRTVINLTSALRPILDQDLIEGNSVHEQ